MGLIGIITQNQKAYHVENRLQQNFKNSQNTIITITEKNIRNLKNVKFETILWARPFQEEDFLKEILKNCKYLIFNVDHPMNLSLLESLETTVITYGFHSKSSITISSMDEEHMLLCIQRSIPCVTGECLEPQEIDLDISHIAIEKNFYNMMGTMIILLIYGKKEVIL